MFGIRGGISGRYVMRGGEESKLILGEAGQQADVGHQQASAGRSKEGVRGMIRGQKGALKGNKGGALLITLAIMMMLTIAVMTAVDTAQTDIELSFNKLHTDQAFYVAEAGLKKALVTLIKENSWEDGYANFTFEEGLFSVAVVHSDVDSLIIDTVTLRSTGTVNRSHANLEALVVPKLWYPFQFAVFGDSTLTMRNSCETDSYNSDSGTYAGTADIIEGDVASNGPVDMINSSEVGGDVSSAEVGGVSVDATCTVTGDIENNVAPYDIDPIPDSAFVAAHDFNSAPGGLSGSYAYDGITHDLTLGTNEVVQLSGGTYFFNDMYFGNTSRLHIAAGEAVVIYVAGDIELESTTSVNANGDPSDLMFFSTGSVFAIGQSIDIHAAFYGPEADVSIGQACEFYGSIIANSVYMENSVRTHYDRTLSDFAVGTTGEMVMIAWREL